MLLNIYIRNIVDCEWNDWINGTCTKSCGRGTMTNTRTKKFPAAHGGEECDGAAAIEDSCNVQNCPGNEIFYCLLSCSEIFQLSIPRYIFKLHDCDK